MPRRASRHLVFNPVVAPERLLEQIERLAERRRGDRVMLPLADIRVVAVEQYGAGPWGTVQLADLGAEMIKIEDPASAATWAGTCLPSRRARTRCSSRRSTAARRASRSTCGTREARGVFEDLVRVSDAVYSNLRGDQPQKLGLTYDAAQARQAGDRLLLAVRVRDDRPAGLEGGYDYMMQGLAGWQRLTGDPDGPPTKSGLSLVDLSGGYASAIALLAGRLAGAPGRRRLRLRRVAVRDGPRTS